MDIFALKSFSASMNETINQKTKDVANEINQKVEQLDQKKSDVMQAGLKRLQEANQMSNKVSQAAAKMAAAGRIDTFV